MQASAFWKAGLCAIGVSLSASIASADILDDIKKRGEMVVGMEVAYVPYEFFQDGDVMGYDVDLTRAFADKLGVKVKFVDTEWAGIIPALFAKKFDVIISGMTITAERAQKVNFSMPYAEATSVVLARADDDSVKSADDMTGKRMGAQLGSAADQGRQAVRGGAQGQGPARYSDYKLYDHYPEAYVDLANKRIDGVVNALSSLQIVIKETPASTRP